MHLHTLLNEHPHLRSHFTKEFGAHVIEDVLGWGKDYRLTTGYSLLVDPASDIPGEGEAFAVATRREEEALWIRLRKTPGNPV